MKILDRIIFIVVGLFLAVLAAVCALLALDIIELSSVADFLSNIKFNIPGALLLLVCAIILFAVAVKILFVTPKKEILPAFSIHKSEDGEISVAITAIENTVKLAMANFEDIKDVKINIGVNATGITISARVSVPVGVVIPELLAEVKEYIKIFTQKHTGVNVDNVKLVAVEYKNVDPANERRRMESVKRQEEKSRPTDRYASTHAKIVLAGTAVESVKAEPTSENTEQTSQPTEQETAVADIEQDDSGYTKV